MTGRSRSGRRSCGCALPRTAARRSCPTRSRSSRRTISSTGSRIRRATISPGWSSRRRPTKFEVTVDLVADMAVINPFDFFLEPTAEEWPFAYDPSLAEEIAPFRKLEPAGAAADGMAGQGRAQEAAHHRFRRRAQCAAAEGDRLHHPPGAGRAELRADAGARQGLVPRHRLAAGHHPAPSRLRRALRLGLPDPAHAGRKAARRTRRADARFHRPPCLVRGLPAGRRLDRPRSDLGPADRRGPHPARLHARAVERGADRGRGREERGAVLLRHEGDAACAKRRAPPSPTARNSGRRCSTSARRSSATSPRRGCGSPWAASRPSSRSTTWTAPNGIRWRSGRRSGGWPACCSASCASGSRQGRCCISARASGIPASSCRAGRSAATGARTARPIWRDPELTALEVQAKRRHAGDSPALRARLRRAAAARSRLPVRGLRGHLVLPVARAAAAQQRRPVDASKATDPLERERLARVFERVSKPCRLRCCRSRASTTAADVGAAGRGSCAARSAT